jgi:hypothetical protein
MRSSQHSSSGIDLSNISAARTPAQPSKGRCLRLVWIYSPKCVEGEFSEVELPINGVLRSTPTDLTTNCPSYCKTCLGRNSGRGHGVHLGILTEGWLG